MIINKLNYSRSKNRLKLMAHVAKILSARSSA
jgi:hypothetical protein